MPVVPHTDAGTSLLGAGFVIGVATAGYQVEGGYNGAGEPGNNWLNWERSGRVERSGVACDFWEHPEEALDRASAIGCNAFRLSVEWARLEPEADHFDEVALARYVEILSMCASPRPPADGHAAPLFLPLVAGRGVLVAPRLTRTDLWPTWSGCCRHWRRTADIG